MTINMLNRRLARLEAAAGGVAGFPTIFVRFMAPDGMNRTANAATIGDRVWRRAEGEDEDMFVARVSAEARDASDPATPWPRMAFLA